MTKTINRKYFLNNPGSGEKEFFKAPDFAESVLIDNRENEVFGDSKPVISINYIYNPQKTKYVKNQYLLIQSFKNQKDELLDNGFFFAGIVLYGFNRTDKLYTYGQLVQLD